MPEIIFLSERKSETFPTQWYSLAQDGHFWMQWRLKSFLQQLRSLKFETQKPYRGMEIGCGDGVLRRQLENHTSWVTDGSDINAQALERNLTQRGSTYFYDIFERRDQFHEAFDFIVLFDVLEHIQDEKKFLEAAGFHLKKGGHVFINVPAQNRFYSVYDEAVGHIRRYDTSMMEQLFQSLDFEIKDMRYWGFSMIPLLALRKAMPSRGKTAEQIIQEGFKPPAKLFNDTMKIMMYLETSLIKRPFAGSSLLVAVQKK
jgi:SAM-dependent methyltransferase